MILFYYQVIITILLVMFLGLVIDNLKSYLPPGNKRPSDATLISICIPARNEQANIESCLQSILASSYGEYELNVLDDCSEDDTYQIVKQLASRWKQINLLQGRPIEPGWAGKCHACAQLASASRGEYLLFMDADTRVTPDLLGSIVAEAEKTGADLVSGFPCQITGSPAEQVVLPMLQFLIITCLPVRQVAINPSPALCAACGQVLLIRRSFYNQVGGHTAIKESFHDGLQLARLIKKQGGKVWLSDLSKLISCRMYRGAGEVWRGFTRNAYEALGSFPALLTSTMLLSSLFLAPYIFLFWGLYRGYRWWPLCLAQVGIILILKGLQAKRFGHNISVILLPLSVGAVIAIQWASMLQRKKPWKGRVYTAP